MSLIDLPDAGWTGQECFAPAAPYRIHGYNSGFWTILNALGQNAVHTLKGAVLFGSEAEARQVALNLGLALDD